MPEEFNNEKFPKFTEMYYILNRRKTYAGNRIFVDKSRIFTVFNI
jgi:hypothetical protein